MTTTKLEIPPRVYEVCGMGYESLNAAARIIVAIELRDWATHIDVDPGPDGPLGMSEKDKAMWTTRRFWSRCLRIRADQLDPPRI